MADGAGLPTDLAEVRSLVPAAMAAATAPGQVRTLVDLRLREWGLHGLAGDVCLIGSELVTNGLVHGSPSVRVWFTREPADGVLLAVWDSGVAMPKVKPAAALELEAAVPDARALEPGHTDGLGGRGLLLVAALSKEWGVTPTSPCGKWVWARFAP